MDSKGLQVKQVYGTLFFEYKTFKLFSSDT